MAPRVFVFVLKADPNPLERLGACLPDGRLVDLQAAHVSMRGVTSPYLRDRTAFRLGGAASSDTVQKVVEWVDSQRPPGLHLPSDRARVVEELP